MKKFYSLAITLSALFFFSPFVNAQTYTAVRNGNWDDSGGTPWDPSGKPPSTCTDCIITINSGVTVTLNTHVILAGTTQLIIGTNDALGNTQLVVPASGSGGTGIATGYNVILDNTSGAGHSKIVLLDNLSSINVPQTSPAAAGQYDGIFSSNNGFLKLVGNAPVAFFADGSVQFIGNTTNDPLTGPATLGASGTLPIILTAFTAVLDSKAVDLDWTTTGEINSDHFAVERSSDAGAHWQVIGTVAAHGVSNLPISYSYTDQNPAAGTNEYRLQMIDRDGKYAYSEVKTIRTGLISSVSIYPNPAKDYVNVTLGGESSASVSLRLLNQAGQTLLEKKVEHAGGTTVSLPVGNYPQGNYLILVAGPDGVQQVSKLLISKN